MKKGFIVLLVAMLVTTGCKKKEPEIATAGPASVPAVPAKATPFAEFFHDVSNAPTTRAWCINNTVWLVTNNDLIQMMEPNPNGTGNMIPVACTGGIELNIPK